MMNEGVSWSGHERNCAYLNLGDGRFADASHSSGLDFHDDGRAVAAVDWDSDGDLDLWLKNRTGPQLRFMRSDAADAAGFVALVLEGTSSNRDAIGAVVEVHTGRGVHSRTVTAGDGYLAQSSSRLHFGLGATPEIERVVVRWPGGGVERLTGIAPGGLYRIVQGTGEASPVPPRRVEFADAPAAGATPSRLTPVLLKVPLQLPPTLKELVFGATGAGRATLVSLWAHWCEPCRTELTELTERYGELARSGLDVVAISIDRPEDRERARELFARRFAPLGQRYASERTVDLLDALLKHVLQASGEISLPTSLLVDGEGAVQMIYLGPIEVERLLEDKQAFLDTTVNGSRRGLAGGRWYYRTPRNLVGLAAELKRRGLREEARYYLALGALSGRGKQGSPPGRRDAR